MKEHARLRDLLERMRRVADRIEESPVQDLRLVSEALTGLLLPHQRGEERAVFPELARRLGGRDPLGAMTRMHEEIEHLATRYGALVDGMAQSGGSAPEAREARRLLYALDAVIGLHLAAEEELLSHVEDLPAH